MADSNCTFLMLLQMELMRPGRHNNKLSAEKSLIGQSGAQNVNLASVGKLQVPLDDLQYTLEIKCVLP